MVGRVAASRGRRLSDADNAPPLTARSFSLSCLEAFGLSRHRAWVVGQGPLGRLVLSLGMPLGCVLESSWEPL
eukprot:2469417-Pyramimonas_sp.AAC.1